MELAQLKYFKTIAETGKISDAAKALFISAPALSTSIARLEKELGMPLFERTNNRIILNQQGRIFLRYVNQILGELDSAKTELLQSTMVRGSYVALASVASAQWVDLIAAFSKCNPEFTLHCTSIRRLDIANSGLSAQYSFLLAADNDIPEYYADKLDSQLLFHEHPMVMVHPEHPLAKRDSVKLEELLQENLYLPMQDYPLYDHLMRLFESCGLSFPAGNAYSHLATQQMVSQGLGVAFATRHTGCTPGQSLKYVSISNPYTPWATSLYWRKNHPFTEDELRFRDFVIDFYKDGLH